MTRPVPLNVKALIVIGGGVTALLLVVIFFLFGMLRGDLDQLGRDLAQSRIERVAASLATKARELHAGVADNAVWTETYEFVQGGQPGFVERNFYNDPDIREIYDFVLVFDRAGNLLGAITHEPGQDRKGPPPGLDIALIRESHLLQSQEGATALIRTPESVALLAGHQIQPTGGEGEPNGTLIYGRFFSPDFLTDLEASTSVRLHLTRDAPPSSAGTPLRMATAELGEFVASVREDWATAPGAWLRIPDLAGRPVVFALAFPLARFADVVRIPRTTMFAVAVGGLVGLIAGLALLELSVLRPIRSLDRQMARVASNPDGDVAIALGGSREFVRLAASANGMLAALRAGRTALAEERRLLESVLDAAAEGLIAFHARRDPPTKRIVDFVIARANPSGLRLLELDPTAVPGWSLHRALGPAAEDDPLWQAFVRAIETGEIQRLVIRCPLLATAAWHDKRVTRWGDGVVLSFSDVTAQRESQERLRESLDEIERFNRAMLGREERVLQIKREVNDLLAELGRPPRYREPDAP